MIFSSLGFIFIFLPITVFGYHLLNRYGKGWPLAFLFFMSMFFYGYWKASYLYIISASLVLNYLTGLMLMGARRGRGLIFALGLALNIGALAYYKYADFAIASINAVAGTHLPLLHVLLPIGISFFTFQQIAYLSDIYSRKHQPDKGLINYSLFICFFPQLIAGPIVHHREMMPQFASEANRRLDWDNIYAGLLMFCLGLGKKVLAADVLSHMVGQSFDKLPGLTFDEAWLGSLAYYLQIYFDFSAYSDMAIGCGLLFNIHLPQNFISPYKSLSIQEFWRRWHITLSRWLRDYLYIPLGGSRNGESRAALNIVLAFTVGGLWHGPAWTFVVWGLLHGLALVVNRYWSLYAPKLPRIGAWILTFLFINYSGVVIRSSSIEKSLNFMASMTGLNGFGITPAFKDAVLIQMELFSLNYIGQRALIVLFLLLCIFGPNSMQILGSGRPTRAKTLFGVLIGGLAIFALSLPGRVTEFIYFQF